MFRITSSARVQFDLDMDFVHGLDYSMNKFVLIPFFTSNQGWSHVFECGGAQ